MKSRLQQKRWTMRSYFPFERDVFFAFYIIRKLIETKFKISPESQNILVPLKKYTFIRNDMKILDRDEFWDFYDMNKSHNIKKQIYFVCNQVIHSYVFSPSWDESAEQNSFGFYFNSWEERRSALYHVYIRDMIPFLEKISQDYMYSLSFRPSNVWTPTVAGDVYGKDPRPALLCPRVPRRA